MLFPKNKPGGDKSFSKMLCYLKKNYAGMKKHLPYRDVTFLSLPLSSLGGLYALLRETLTQVYFPPVTCRGDGLEDNSQDQLDHSGRLVGSLRDGSDF